MPRNYDFVPPERLLELDLGWIHAADDPRALRLEERDGCALVPASGNRSRRPAFLDLLERRLIVVARVVGVETGASDPRHPRVTRRFEATVERYFGRHPSGELNEGARVWFLRRGGVLVLDGRQICERSVDAQFEPGIGQEILLVAEEHHGCIYTPMQEAWSFVLPIADDEVVVGPEAGMGAVGRLPISLVANLARGLETADSSKIEIERRLRPVTAEELLEIHPPALASSSSPPQPGGPGLRGEGTRESWCHDLPWTCTSTYPEPGSRWHCDSEAANPAGSEVTWAATHCVWTNDRWRENRSGKATPHLVVTSPRPRERVSRHLDVSGIANMIMLPVRVRYGIDGRELRPLESTMGAWEPYACTFPFGVGRSGCDARSGYRASLDLSDLPPGEHRLQVVANMGTDYAIGEMSVVEVPILLEGP